MSADAIRGWTLLEQDERLARASWRLGRHGLPVLERLPPDFNEQGDTRSRGGEPDPLALVRSSTLLTVDTSGQPHESEWWEEPYKGGPMVVVKGFPRPCYPPDAAPGHTRSSDGSDVTAYKRTVSRLGRWPWDPQGWDDSYSNAFAHGKSGGMVGDSGVAGVQRQGTLSPDTGWVGSATFNLLRSARVPEGLPHAGEMAMDGVAVNLINDAYDKFNGGGAHGTTNDVYAAITDFCVRSIRAAIPWHYEQYRPMRYLGTSPDATHQSDCSEHATEAYYWARTETGVSVPDPNHSGFNGYGYTGTLVNNPRVTSGKYQVGDLAIYGSSTSDTEHVCSCYEAGDAKTSEWCSHGSEAAPYAVELHYRSDLLCVVRPGISP
jgi:hypothetical protein